MSRRMIDRCVGERARGLECLAGGTAARMPHQGKHQKRGRCCESLQLAFDTDHKMLHIPPTCCKGLHLTDTRSPVQYHACDNDVA